MLLLGKTQKKHPGDLPPTVPELPPPLQIAQAVHQVWWEQDLSRRQTDEQTRLTISPKT